MTATASSSRTAYRHEAFLWGGDAEYLDGCLRFVLDGLAAGEPVMVVTTRTRTDLLAGGLGPDVERVRFVDMEVLGANPARIIPAWTDFLRSAGGRSCRGIGEPVWSTRSAAELAECHLHEALLNVAVPHDTPFWLLCPYDRDALPGSELASAARTHPVVTGGDTAGGELPRYAGPAAVVAAFEDRLPEPPEVDLAQPFGAADLRAVRHAVALAAAVQRVPEDRAADLTLAVHELAANSVQHGGGGGLLRVWRDAGDLVVEVSDAGHLADPMVGRRRATGQTPSGRGIWMANQLCDLVQLRSSAAGTTVRLHTWC